MLRLTVSEAAAFLGRRKHWVYNLMHKKGLVEDGSRLWVTVENVEMLLQAAFEAKTYESYPFKVLTGVPLVRRFIKGLAASQRLADMKYLVTTPDDYAALLIAMKLAKPDAGMFNHIAYSRRKLRDNSNIRWLDGDSLKNFAYRTLAYMVAAGKAGIFELESGEDSDCSIASELSGEVEKELIKFIRTKYKTLI